MYVLEMIGLKKRYENFGLDIDLNINKGEFVAIIGPNGAGKSTTINALLNIIEKDSGEIKIFGKDHIKYEAEIKEDMGVILEEQYFYENIMINSILNFYSKFYPNWNKKRLEELREKFGLKDNKKFKDLSKGMKVKLAFIIALSTGASFYVFDEPTSGLDPAVRHTLLSEVLKLKQDKNNTLLFTSHIMSDIEYFTDRIIFINKGKIVIDESLKTLKHNWKKIEFQSNKKINFSQIKNNLFKVRKEGYSYIFIVNKEFEFVRKEIELQIENSVEVKDMNLNELFIEVVNKDADSLF